MTAPLGSARAKAARATLHLREMDEACRHHRASGGFDVDVSVDTVTGDQVVRARNVKAPPALPALGDVLYNFRSALDHAANAMVVAAGNAPTKDTCWPILNESGKWKSVAGTVTAGMSSPMVGWLKDHQPCFGNNQFVNRALWALQEYGNIDKHRRVLLLEGGSGGMFWQPEGPSKFVHEGAVEEGTILAVFPAGAHKTAGRPVPTIVFGEGESQGHDVQRILGLLQLTVPRLFDELDQLFFSDLS